MKSLMTKKLNRVLTLVLTFMALMAGQTAWAADDWTVTNPTGSTFRITRPTSHVGTTETVKYRTVSLSAYAGQHYTAVSGDVAFGVNDTYKEVTVTENSPTTDAYKYQTGTKRKYRFEVTDQGGFYLHHCDREITTGTSVTSSGVFDVKDVTIQSSEYTANDDGYDVNGYKSVDASSYCTSGTQEYLSFLNAQLCMTLSFLGKENDDAYEYLQLLVDNTSTCDNRSECKDGDPGNISLSKYMAGFEMNTGSKDDTYRSYTFPITTVGNNGSASDPWGYGTKYPLSKQKFNGCRATDGRIIIPTNFSTLVLRLNASGTKGSDEWAVKEVKAHIQAVDVTAPTMLANSITVAPGRHSKGNTVYVSVAFNEIVKVTGTPKLTTTSANNWGDLNYVAGDGTNVLTFSTTIPANASGNLNITSLSGTVKDLAGNSLTGSDVTASGLCSVDASFAYTITYNLGEGVLPDGYPTTYTYDAAVTLTNPTKTGYWFNGWTGSNGNTPNTTVTIVKNSHGNKSYTANWTNVWGVSEDVDGTTAEKAYTITTTQGLDLLATLVNNGEFRNFEGKFFKLGDDITYTHGNSNTENNYTAIGGYYNGGNKYFSGTFDGQGHTVRGIRIYKAGTTNAGDNVGLFGITSGATIKNVILADARITGRQCVGGIAGYIEMNGDNGGMCENCRVGSDVTIHAVANYAGSHGGVVGRCNGGTIFGCVSAATLTVANGLTGINTYGGIVGYLNGNMSDCLAIGATVPAVDDRGAIAGRCGTQTNNYYHDCTVGDATHQSDAYTISAGTNVTVAPAGDAAQTYKYKGIQRYGNALYYGGKFYAPEAADVSLTLDYPVPAGLTIGYAATAGTLNLTPNPSPSGEGSYTLTMPAEDVTINAKLKVSYIDENGDEQWCTDYTLIDGSTTTFGVDGGGDWYVVSGNVTFESSLQFKDGIAHLIICDGATLTVKACDSEAIKCNYALAIYGQADGTGIIDITNTKASGDGIYARNNLTINGCHITCNTEERYGTGIYSDGYNLTINRGTITTKGYDGIYAFSNLIINGGTINATGSHRGLAGYHFFFNGGNVTATGGSGYDCAGIYFQEDITLGWSSPDDRIYASSYAIGNDEHAMAVKVKDDQTLYAGYMSADGVTISKFTGTIYDNNGGNPTGDLSVLAGKTLEPGIPFYINNTDILLDDDTDQPDGYKNTDRLAANFHSSGKDIMLYGRTLYRDGDWNTLCLPFDVVLNDQRNPLHGATIMYFDYRYWYDTGNERSYNYIDGYHRSGEIDADGSLHLYFNSENCINAGDPYIVKWETTGDPIVNPVFKDVVVANTIPYDWHTTEEGPGNVTFRGTYSPINYESDNHSILFLGMNNTLYWPKEGAHIGAFRAYFELGNGLTVGEEASQVRSFNLGFGEGSDETGIDSMHNSECLMLNEADAWYSLDGRKLDGKPNARGIYVKNGKKVVIK